MEEEDKFVSIVALMCEPSRAKMMWKLLDGKAYTAGELAIAADISVTAASNHLKKLLDGKLLKVESQGRHKYFSYSGPEVAYAVEGLANLASPLTNTNFKNEPEKNAIKYCRTCYDHLAGYVAVKIVEELEGRQYLLKSEKIYKVSESGWEWFSKFGILQNEFDNRRRPLTRQCLDWSERRPHLAGNLGAAFLQRMLERKWVKKKDNSRELTLTPKGRKEIYELLGLDLM